MRLFIFLAAILLQAPPLRADTAIQDIRWQLATGRQPRPIWHEVKGWLQPPSLRLESRPRALVQLHNPGARADEAVLVRFSVSARLAKKEGSAQEGHWSLPFLLEDRRVPRIKAGETRALPIHLNRVVLQTYLGRMYRAGFWPDALRIQLVVEPRTGGELREQVAEQVLPVFWRQPSHNGNGSGATQ